MNSNLKTTGLTKRMLRESIQKNTYWNRGIAPFHKNKAIWLLSNKRIEEDEYCFVITTEDEKIVSFVHMIPDLLNLKNQDPQKIYWIVYWWVAPKFQNSVVATYTFYEALKLSNNKIIIKWYAEHIAEFYNKLPLTVIASRLRYTIFLSLDPSMLVGKFKFLKPFRSILDSFDYIIASIINRINYNKLKKTTKNLFYDYINEIDYEAWKFIEPLCKNDLIIKSKGYINWSIDNKQYTQISVPSKQRYKVLKTGSSNNIHIHNLKIIQDGNMIGFLSYIVNYNEFNVKYFLVEKEEHYNLCIDVLIENFINKKSKFIFTDDTKLAKNIKKRFLTTFTHKSLKKGLAHNSLGLNIENANLLDRDGHFY
ncbi:hypothetical protein [Jejuia spongiicola]|uniref:GNAT family N-acetyltransferase n=1 Tax=Jejuia spongiicola TaxID=2942207 RepID=A0ABT0QEG5_9FLAO|nr:hypothetical protein [Jejuia spongiicola]MCL6294978.1 hypothetical protein [Jejuia spongiicola]